MPDFTLYRRLRATVAVIGLAVTATISLGWIARAQADGDPASDVLAAQRLFLPQDGSIPLAQQSELTALDDAAQRSGYPLRVALIATRNDLGSVTALWRQPENYARFLAVELSEVVHGTLLVVMPHGFGVARVGASGRAVASTKTVAPLSELPPPGAGASLATAAVTAIQRLAAADGHRLPAVSASPIAAGAHSAPGSGLSLAAWLALGIGAVLIAAAWTVSLRVRPPHRRDGVASSHGS